jgi:hypothetical protein
MSHDGCSSTRSSFGGNSTGFATEIFEMRNFENSARLVGTTLGIGGHVWWSGVYLMAFEHF